MPSATTPNDLSQIVRQQVEEILRDPATRQALFGQSLFGSEDRAMLTDLNEQVGNMLQDYSLGQVTNGGLWLDGASVVNGTITAPKLVVNTLEAITTNTGALNVTGNIVAATSYPAVGARVVINSAGITGYSGGVDTTFFFDASDGSGYLGPSASRITWTSSGLTVPAATIGSLTIALVGGGVLGGTYQTATTGAHINLSTAGIVAYNATSEISANETFRLNAATGAMTATGSFTIRSAASGARVVVSNAGGVEGYNSSGTRTFFLNAADGSFVGGTGSNTFAITSGGTAQIGGVSLSSGKITASHLSVSTLSAISADMGTITAGTINGGTINASTITTGTLLANRVSGGTLGGSYSLGASSITVDSTGRVNFGSGDYLANDRLHFEVTGTETAKMQVRNASATNRRVNYSASIASTSHYCIIYADDTTNNHNAYVQLNNQSSSPAGAMASLRASTNSPLRISGFYANANASSYSAYMQAGGGLISVGDAEAYIEIGNNTIARWESTNRRTLFAGYIYPGTGTGTQSTGYINWNASESTIKFEGSEVHIVNALRYGQLSTSGGSGALPNPTKYIAIKSATGTVYYIPIFTAFASWAA